MTGEVPQRSEYINCKGLIYTLAEEGKGNLCILQRQQAHRNQNMHFYYQKEYYTKSIQPLES